MKMFNHKSDHNLDDYKPAKQPRRNWLKLVTNNRKHMSMAVFIVLFAAAGTSLLVLSRAAPVGSVKSGNWNDPSVWGGRVPGSGDLATIGAGHTVTFNTGTTRVGGVRVNSGGTLVFSPNQSVTLESSENIIVEGELEMKPANASIKHTIRMVGISETAMVGGGMDPLASDKGLWVMGAGKLDLAGARKTGWTRASGSISSGATSVALESAPTGWAAGDEISIAPTESPASGSFVTGFDQRSITSVSGSTINLNSGTSRPHPAVNGKWRAEVMNLTRNVMIEGTQNGRTHIFIRSSQPQSIKYVGVRYFGPRKPSGDDSDFVLGRYGIHFHMANEGSRGSLVEGTVLRDGGSHAYVPHLSHGVTFRDTVAYNNFEEPYWWDLTPDTRSVGDETHDTLYDHAIAAIVKFDPNFRGYGLSGFSLSQGNRNEARDCAAVGVQGAVDAAGFNWTESGGATSDNGRRGHGEWNFARNNVSHNNAYDGLFAWQNDSQPHVISDFVAYHNGRYGIKHGAYINLYHYENSELYGNGEGGVWNNAVNDGTGAQMAFSNMIIDGAGISDHLINISRHNLASEAMTPIRYENTTLRGAKRQAILMTSDEHNEAAGVEFINSTVNGTPMASANIANTFSWGGGQPNASYIRVQNGSTAFRLSNPASGGVPTRANTGTFATPLFDSSPPQPSFDYPTGGTFVNGTVNVAGYAHDLHGVTRVEFIVDGTVRGTDTAAPYNFSWNTSGLTGKHNIQLRGFDARGNAGLSPLTTVFIGTGDNTTPPPTPPPTPPTGDTTAPTVSVTAPANNATVSGTIAVTASAGDNIGVTKVEFLVDGQLRNTDTSSPYSFNLNTTSPALSNGSHSITAKAYDAAGNSMTSAARAINVNNTTATPPPPPPPPTFLKEDINQDGRVDLRDFSVLAGKFGQTSNLGRADINGDGRVNLVDFSLLAAKFGQ